MPKNIVICCDGTGNEYGDRKTNVLKLFSILPGDDSDQVAFYDPGVGTFSAPAALTRSAKLVSRVLGLAFAYGITKNIEDAYRYLMQQYEEGDRVFLFGFSRGAHTARALAAMLHKCGLLNRGNENLIPYATKMFKFERDKDIYKGFKRSFARRCPVHFLGLWDTVTTVGWVYDPVKLPFTRRNPSIGIVRHATAIDERRCFYRQNMWGDPYEGQDVSQVWFAGVHSDVGGSYPEAESGLAQIALEWMLGEAVPEGLKINPTRLSIVLPQHGEGPNDHLHPDGTRETYVAPDHSGESHRSLHGPWWIAEFLPKLYHDPRQNFKKRLMVPLGRPRFIPRGARFHRSVDDRRKAMNYNPPRLPPDPVWVDSRPIR